MSKNCIPTRLREEFYAVMQANDDDDLPDGAWFCRLEETAEQFIEKYKLRWADRNDAAHQYIRMCNEPLLTTIEPPPAAPLFALPPK